MPKGTDILETIAQLSWEDLPNEVRQQSKLCLLDLIGVAAGGTTTRLSKIARDYAVLDMSGPLPLVFDGRGGSVAGLQIVSFHEAVRLGQKNAITTEEAQYSTSFPCALALVHGTVMPQHVADEALGNPEVQRLSAVLSMDEDNYANRLFPLQRMARAEITLHAGDILKSGWFEPKWDATAPPHRTNWKKNSTLMRGLSWVRRAAMPCTWPSCRWTKPRRSPCLTYCLSRSAEPPT